MSEIFDILQLLIACGTILVLAFLVLLSLPDCQLRQMVLPFAGWGLALFCALYVISPVDILPAALLGPIGGIDDIVAIVTGLAAASAAKDAQAKAATRVPPPDDNAQPTIPA